MFCEILQGLAGSSAIVVATLKCLIEFFHLDPDVSVDVSWSSSI